MGQMLDLPLYHGTNSDIKAFDLSFGGAVSRSPVGSQGVSLSPSPGLAGEFASRAGDEGANILKVFHRADNPGLIDLPDGVGNTEVSGYIDQAWGQGYDAVRLRSYTTPSGKKGETIYIVKNPNQIRSVNADFNPDLKDSADLLAGIGGAAVLGGAALTPEDAMAADMDAVALQGAGGWKAKSAKRRSKWAQFKEPIAEPAATKLGGISNDLKLDTIGDTRGNKTIPGAGSLFSSEGAGLDDVAMRLHERGFIPATVMENLGGVPYLQEALKDELAGVNTKYAVGSEAETNVLLKDYEADLATEAEAEARRLEAEALKMAREFEAEYGEIPAGEERAYIESLENADYTEIENIGEIDYDQLEQEIIAQKAEAEALDVQEATSQDSRSEGSESESGQPEALSLTAEQDGAEKEPVDTEPKVSISEDGGLYSENERESTTIQGGESSPIISERQDDAGRANQIDLFAAPEENKQEAYADLYGTVVEARPVQKIRTGIDQITHESHLAHLMAPIRKDAQEAFYAIATDSDGNVLRVMRSTRGAKSSASVRPLDIIAEAASIDGIRTIHYAHNHPSGGAKPSGADERITEVLNGYLDGTDIDQGFHVVIGESEWAEVGFGSETYKIPPAARTKTVDITERRLTKRATLGEAVTSPELAVKLTSNHDNAIFLLNNANKPVAVIPISDTEMLELRSNGRAARILGAIDKSNASAVIVKTTDREAGDNVSRFLSRFGDNLRVLDVLVGSGESIKSLASTGNVSEEGVFFSRQSIVPENATPKGVNPKQAQRRIDTFLAKYKGADDVTVRVYTTQEEAFGPESRKRYGKIKGGFDPDTNTLHIVAANLDSFADLQSTLQHEILAHKGLGFFATEDVAALLDAIIENKQDRSTPLKQ